MSNEIPLKTLADAARIRAALEQLLKQPAFMRAPQMSSFLRYVVERTLCGESERIKAYTIGIDALGKPSDFDPQTDPSVRVLAKRLRDRLRAHYAHHVDAPLRIELVSGSYTPRFSEPDDRLPIDQPEPHAHPRHVREAMFRIDGREPVGQHPSPASGTRESPVASATAARDRLLCGAPPGAPALKVLYLITSSHDDRLAQNITFLLSNMLARMHGTDARRVSRTPAAIGQHDRSLTVHVTPLSGELRVDLQVCHGVSGEIVSADVLELHPSEDATLASEDLDRLETWVSKYRAPVLPTTHSSTSTPETPARLPARRTSREPLAGWLASGRTLRVSLPDADTAAGEQPAPRDRAAGF